MKLIETKTLASAAASIEFTSIPQDGTDLVVLISGRNALAGNSVSLGLVINSAASDTSWRSLVGTGSTVLSNSASGVQEFFCGDLTGSSATANTFGNLEVYIPNYTSSNAKSLSASAVSENNATAAIQSISAGLCTKTAAVTSITLKEYLGANNILTGSIFSLYKVTKGSDGIVTTS